MVAGVTLYTIFGALVMQKLEMRSFPDSVTKAYLLSRRSVAENRNNISSKFE